MNNRKRKQLHQSGIEMAAKCGEQFFRRYIRGEKRPPKTFLISGQAVDRGVTLDLNTKIETGVLASTNDVVDAVADTVAAYADWDSVEREDDEVGKSIDDLKGQTKDKAIRLATVHHGVIAPQIIPFQVARKFSVNLDKWLLKRSREMHEDAERYAGWVRRVKRAHATALGSAAKQGYDFVGEQDIVEKLTRQGEQLATSLIIRDTKTSKKSPTQDAADESHQLTAYALASQVIDHKLPDAVKLDYVVDLKRETKAMTLESHRDALDLDIYLNRIEATVVSIVTGNFTPAPNAAWWCDPRYCGYYSTCKYVRNRELVQITTDLEGKANG